MIDLFADLGPWTWVILGLVLFGLELAAPGVFFVWLGVAAVLTGCTDWLLDLSWQGSFIVFAALAIAAVMLGRKLTGYDSRDEASHLNRRGEALVGRLFTLDQPIAQGEGRVKVDDSYWRIKGPDTAAGRTVRVVRVDGATLIVEAA